MLCVEAAIKFWDPNSCERYKKKAMFGHFILDLL